MQTLQDLIKQKDISGIKEFMAQNGLVLSGNRIVPVDETAAKKLKDKSAFWNQRQQAR